MRTQQGRIIGYQGENKKILIVDDQAINRLVLKEVLQPLGFAIAEAEQGQQGLEIALEFQPDLMITDLMMPVMNGFELVRKLRQSEIKNTIAIASSASVSEQEQGDSIAAGCNDFLPKPVDIEKLLSYLQKYLQLEWIYAETEGEIAEELTSESELIFPPEAELMELRQAAKIGDIETVQTEAKKLADLKPEYRGFGDRILALAAEFDDRGIIKLLDRPQSDR